PDQIPPLSINVVQPNAIETSAKSASKPTIFMSEDVAKQVSKLTLSGVGAPIPAMAFGTKDIVYNKQATLLRRFNNDQKAAEVIIEALKSGYRHIDSAYFYNVEHAINIALALLSSKNLIKRHNLYITTKVWMTFHRRDRVLKGLKISLVDMGVEYVDMAILHYPTGLQDGAEIWPLYGNGSSMPRSYEKNDFLEAWKGMEKASRLGIAKAIGVANFNADQLKTLLSKATIKPAVNQVECNPTYQQNEMLEFCNQNGIKMVAYSPLRGGDYQLVDNPVLAAIGKKYGKTAAQVALRWNFQRGVVVLPKAAKKKHQDDNIDIFNFELAQEDMDKIANIPQLPRVLQVPSLVNHSDYPF
ncbi:unnamed protein product, partial [Medioppia subpectinata]